MEMILSSQNINRNGTEPLRRPWAVDSIPAVPFGGVSIHGKTGALCLPGIKIDQITHEYERSKIITHFSVFTGRLFVVGPPNAAEGDWIFFLHGLDSPVLLRRQATETESVFVFVGMCHAWAQTGVTMKASQAWNRAPLVSPLSIRWGLLNLQIASQRLLDAGDTHEIDATSAALFQDTEPDDYSESHYRILEAAGGAVETAWSSAVREHLPVLFLVPSLRKGDLMEPAIPVLEELATCCKMQARFWREVISLLESCRSDQDRPDTTLASSIKAKRDTVQRYIDELTYNESDEHLTYGTIEFDETAREKLQCLYSPSPGTAQSGVEGLEDDSQGPELLSMPTWYLATRSGDWNGLQKIQLQGAYVSLAQALLTLNQSRSPQELSKLESSIAEARYWEQSWNEISIEARAAKEGVTILIRKRKEYLELMSDGWKPIVII